MAVLQGSLLDMIGDPGPRPLCAVATERSDLGDGAWVDVRRGWIGGADALFERLLATVPWRAERRPMYEQMVDVPRLMAFYGEGDPLPDPLLEATRADLTAYYRAEPGGPFCTAGLCLYRDGRDSVAWHGDTIGRGARSDTLVSIVSLGATRRLSLRRGGGGATRRIDMASGDLLVMGGSCQRTWQHAVLKSARSIGPRLSVQFRQRGVR